MIRFDKNWFSMRMIEKKNWNVNWKWQMLNSQKIKKNDQKFERILTKNKKLLKFIKLIKFVVMIWMTIKTTKNNWSLIRLYVDNLNWHENIVILFEKLLMICERIFDVHKILTFVECCYYCNESLQSHMQKIKSMIKYVSNVKHKLMKIRKSLFFINEQRFANC